MKPARLPEGYDATLTPGEVARIFGVDAKTVARWEASGKLPGFRTPGGHRRFRDADVRALIEATESSEW
jgi:excisionase family DNA binding protein